MKKSTSKAKVWWYPRFVRFLPIILSLATASLAHYFLLNTQRSIDQFPLVASSVLLVSALVWGLLLGKVVKDDEIPLKFPSDFNLSLTKISKILLALAAVFSILSAFQYYKFGYSPLVLSSFLLSIALSILALWPLRARHLHKYPRQKADLVFLAAILVFFAPLYLLSLYTIPWQVNTDEVTISNFAQVLSQNTSTDPLGISSYLGFPSLTFVIWGHLANLIGGITLENVRIIHATSGLAIITAFYFLSRLFFRPFEATVATFILGSNHALLSISRMAMRDNTSLLVEVIAIYFLLRGLVLKCPTRIFIGGLLAGLSFYVYFPSRATPILWFLFLGLAYVYFVHKVKLSSVLKIIAVSFLGLSIASAPIIISTLKDKSGLAYSKETTLLFPEGRKIAQTWASTLDVKSAVSENIARGLLTFNGRTSDQGWIYPNPNHGFADPLTGLLVWLGLGVVLTKKHKELEDILIVGSFIFLLTVFSFIFNKAPSYTRLLVILPFSTFLVVEGLTSITRLILSENTPAFKPGMRAESSEKENTTDFSPWKFIPRFKKLLLATGTILIITANLWIYKDFVQKGISHGDSVGGIGRYLETKAENDPKERFYIVADNNYPVYSWGQPQFWQIWAGFFARNNLIEIQNPNTFNPASLPARNIALIMNRNLYNNNQQFLNRRYPDLKVIPLNPSASILAIEID